MGLRDYLLDELKKQQESLKDRLAFSPVEDYASYREIVGEIRAFQRLIRAIEELPDE